VIYVMLLMGVFVTAFYSFRMFFLVFHGKPRWADAGHGHEHHGHGGEPHESPWVVTLPLIALAVPSVLAGHLLIETFLVGDFFDGVIVVDPSHPAMATLGAYFKSATALALHSVETWPFWLAVSGVALAAVFYLWLPAVPASIARQFGWLHRLLEEKYFMDAFNQRVFAGGAHGLGTGLWRRADQGIIDGFFVNGSARLVAVFASILRLGQTGFLYHYAIAMILGVALLLWWFAPLSVGPVTMPK
jgi:NADH-quinone oxidoreductase subunit L